MTEAVFPLRDETALRQEVAVRAGRLRWRRRGAAASVVGAGLVVVLAAGLPSPWRTALHTTDTRTAPAQEGPSEVRAAAGGRVDGGPPVPMPRLPEPDAGRLPPPALSSSTTTTSTTASRPSEPPAPPPSSLRILFVRDNKVHELPADGSAPRVVVAEHAFDAAWSPDGSAVAYTSLDSATGRRRTSIADLQSGASRVVLEFPGADSVEPAWSPDGRAIAVTRVPLASSPDAGAEPGVWVVDVATGEHHEAVLGRHPSWTPRGNLLFDCAEGLCTAAVDGSDRRVVPGTDKLHDAAWSSAGNLIAAVDNRSRLVLVRSDGTGRRVLADHVPGGVVWSPDGARAVYPVDPTVGCATRCAADPGLWSLRSDGGDRRRLTDRSSDRSPSAVPAHPSKGAGE